MALPLREDLVAAVGGPVESENRSHVPSCRTKHRQAFSGRALLALFQAGQPLFTVIQRFATGNTHITH